jgi:hypothetical protein
VSDTTQPNPSPDRPWHLPDFSPDKPEVTVNRDQIINRQGKDFVLWAGLLDAAHRAGLQSIHTNLIQAPSSTNGGLAIVFAEAVFRWGSYSGIGDASEANVGRMIAPHIVRMAETRAKARALRDALNVGMAAIEELGPDDDDRPATGNRAPAQRSFAAEEGVGTAAPRRVVQAQVKTPPTPTPAPQSSGSTAVDEERTKFQRLAATAQRLGLQTVTLTDDAPLEYIVEQRNTLLREVNQVLAKQRGSGK